MPLTTHDIYGTGRVFSLSLWATFSAQVWYTTTLSTGNAFRLRDSMAGLDYELRFSNHDYYLESAHPFPHNPPSLATLHGLSFSGWAQVCCRFGIFTHVLVLSRGPSPVPYLCITNIGSHTLLDPSNILSVGRSKKFLLFTALMAPLGSKTPPSVVECRSTGRLRVDWEYQPCYGAFTGPSNDPHHDFY